MCEMERQTAAGKVLWHFTMSLDGLERVNTGEPAAVVNVRYRPVS